MFQKSSCQIRFPFDPTLGLTNLAVDLSNMVRTKVGHFSSGYIGPKILHRVQIRSIWWQGLCLQPTFLRANIIFNNPAAMCGQRIPDKKQLAPTQHAFKPFQMSNDIRTADRTVFCAKEQPHISSGRSCHERGNGRQTFPTERLPQDRSFSARRPCPANRGPLRKAALVKKSDEPVQLADFFLRRGQCFSVHSRTSLSLRSRACLSGFWQLHPSPRRRRQTC